MSKLHESDQSAGRSHAEYRVGETPSEAVVSAVADATGRSSLEMAPLWEAVDTDALNALFDRPGRHESSLSVTFEYCDRHVTVTEDAVRIAQLDSRER